MDKLAVETMPGHLNMTILVEATTYYIGMLEMRWV
jgi:hypothetical protein